MSRFVLLRTTSARAPVFKAAHEGGGVKAVLWVLLGQGIRHPGEMVTVCLAP